MTEDLIHLISFWRDMMSKEPRNISTSTDFSHVIMRITLTLCRRLTIGVNIRKRLVGYFALIVIGGLFGDYLPNFVSSVIPFQTSKRGFLNQWFVKIGWFWTIILLGPFIHMTSQISSTKESSSKSDLHRSYHEKSLRDDSSPSSRPSSRSSSHVKRDSNSPLIVKLWITLSNKDLLRLWVNTLFWYLSTSAFTWFESITISCSSGEFSTQESCTKSGNKWIGFDISGHTFILLFSLLVIMEECSIMKGWEPFGERLFAEQQNRQRTFRQDYPQHVIYSKYKIYIRCFFLALTGLTLIWNFMLFQTALFYHTTLQKLIAYLWAVGLWFFGYKCLYNSKYFSSVFKVENQPHLKE
ncbi:acyl-coenzyme A diphosphatase FITM2-like isoform X2 [Panonychus citri]|uniref:acyl-coenzyme A diphosphatase FITM2-like isoform X2 n=1 Tax=Panonychus citri TaxID=50023 RepID=UPI0023070F33|nr:acyl-coenzyme A diphosphatase FITM2-like isoform X2 [Panonychus citri]